MSERFPNNPNYSGIRSSEEGSLAEVTLNKANEHYNMLYIDETTGCYKKEFLKTWMNRVDVEKLDHKLVAVYLDVDGLKFVNDKYGHSAGNKLLQTMGEALLTITRKADNGEDIDIPFRIHGDEFLMLFSNDTDMEESEFEGEVIDSINSICKNYEGHNLPGEEFGLSFSFAAQTLNLDTDAKIENESGQTQKLNPNNPEDSKAIIRNLFHRTDVEMLDIKKKKNGFSRRSSDVA